MRVARTVLMVGVVLCVAVALAVAQEKSKKGKGGRPRGNPLAWQMRMFEGLDLTGDQKTKLDALQKEYSPKLDAAGKKRQEVLTEEQRKGFPAAMKAAAEAGKRGPEVRDAVYAELKVTNEQKEKLAEIEKETQELNQEFSQKARDLLTQEQLEKLKERFKRGAKPRAKQKQ